MSYNKKSISKLLINRLIIFSIAINLIAMLIISNTVSGLVNELEDEHLNEIVSHIESDIILTIDRYVALAEVLSKNTSIINLMIDSDKNYPMHTNQNKDVVLNELQTIEPLFDGNLINFALLDDDQDGYITQNNIYSDDDFSFKERPYYSVVENKETLITSPYLDALTGEMIFSVVVPIFNFDNAVEGVILLDLSMEFLHTLILNTEYKKTGSSLIIDDDNIIIAHSDTSLIGKSIFDLNFEKNKDKIELEILNPTHELIIYSLDDVEQIGIFGDIEKYNWTIFTFMSYNEFTSYTSKILIVFSILQFITVLLTLFLVSLTVRFSLKPITYIKKAMKELADGNTDYILTYTSNNEIGALADDVRFASQNLSSYINRIQNQLDYDDLTNLYTERKFITEVQNKLNDNLNTSYFIVSLDIDNFKYINNTYGYDVGSEFLKVLANYYELLLSTSKVISRVHGDNYLFFLTESQMVKMKNGDINYFETIRLKAKAIIDESYDLSISCGIYKIEDKTMNISSMIDCSSYAKNKGKSRAGFSVNYYDNIMNEERASNNYVVSKMRDGIKNKEFVVYYQPKVDLITNKIAGAETLVRWYNNGDIIPPNKFIPVFEMNGFIETLDYYIIERTCEFIKNNNDKNIPVISINLSGVTLMKKNVVTKILSILETYNIKTNQIELEITESAFVNNFDLAVERINKFIELGFRISMDDFGCGESSLGRLKDIPIHVIKIDRDFIIQTFNNDKAELILKNIVNMAKDLNLKTVVEGIETEEQRNLITKMGCDLGQGYLFSKPVPADEFLKMLI
ncbi:MAG: EAL domain-containing protein [bacterium]